MNKSIGFFVLVVGTLFGTGAAQAVRAADIFVTSPIYSLKPDGGAADITSGSFGDLAKKNGHWDAATKTVTMVAARNEEVAVQIVIPEDGKGWSAEVSDFSGPGTIKASQATFSAIVWSKLENNLFSDVLIPLDGTVAGIKDMDIPCTVKGVADAQNKAGAILFELWVPKDAKAGAYTGTLKVKKAGAESAALKVNLTVFDFALPDQPSYAFEYLSYDMPFRSQIVSGDGVPLKAIKMRERQLKMNHQVYKLVFDNRAFVNILPYHGQRGAPMYAYPVSGQGADAKITSFAEYDEVFGPILEGKLNKFGKGPIHFTLPFNANYPHVCQGDPAKQFDWMGYRKTIPEGPGKNPALKEFEETNKAIAEQMFKHFAEKGWKDSIYEFYHNQKPDGVGNSKKDGGARNKLCWKLDEPTDKEDYQGLRYFLNVNRWSVSGLKDLGLKFANRIDLGHFHCDKLEGPDGKVVGCSNAKSWDKADGKGILGGVVDHWVLGVMHADAARKLIPGYERPGVKMETYSSQPLKAGVNQCAYRGETYRAAQRGIVGNVYFKFDISCGNPASLGAEGKAASYSEFMLYDGTKVGYDGALAARRTKLWRDSINDFDYIAQARAKDPAATQAVVERMTVIGQLGGKTHAAAASISANNNPEAYLAAKIALADIIAGKKVDAAKTIPARSKDYQPSSEGDKITNYD